MYGDSAFAPILVRQKLLFTTVVAGHGGGVDSVPRAQAVLQTSGIGAEHAGVVQGGGGGGVL